MVGQRIKQYLEDNGIKQGFVAAKVGIPHSQMSDILNNGRTINCVLYAKICRALNVSLETFIPEDEDEEED